jgi:hypothetical protein
MSNSSHLDHFNNSMIVIARSGSYRCHTHRLAVTELDLFLFSYVFPVQFVLGQGMHNRANDLLAAVALCDITVFSLMLPFCLAAYDIFATNQFFRFVYLSTRMNLAAVANWWSAASIW